MYKSKNDNDYDDGNLIHEGESDSDVDSLDQQIQIINRSIKQSIEIVERLSKPDSLINQKDLLTSRALLAKELVDLGSWPR